MGRERVDEIENPELAQERMKALYERQGDVTYWQYSIASLKSLTQERICEQLKTFNIKQARPWVEAT